MLTERLPTNYTQVCHTANTDDSAGNNLACDANGECIKRKQTCKIRNTQPEKLEKLPYDIHLREKRKIPPLNVYRNDYQKKNRKWRCRTVDEKRPEKKCLPTIEGPFGILLGIFKLDDFLVSLEDIQTADIPENVSRALQALSSCLIAFGHIFITPENEWSVITLSETLDKGKLLYQDSIRTIAPPLAAIRKEYVSNQFTLCQNRMAVEISEPIIVGVLQCNTTRVYSIIVGLEMFFQKFDHCLCEIQGNFFLIWKTNNSFFLYDCYGRTERGFRDTQDGKAVLVCVCNVRNIEIILEHMSKMQPDAVYTLYQLKMKGILKCCDKPMKFQGGPRKEEYQVLTKHHAILEGKFHIEHSSFRDSLHNQALATCMIGIAYSKIDPPSSWDSSVVDNVMVMGHRLHQTLTERNPEKCITIKDIPAHLPLGQFTVTIHVTPWAFEGNWPTGQSCKNNEAIQKLKSLFRQKCTKNVILQVNNRTYALWERNRYYYVLDPYCRSLVEAAYSSNPKKCSTLHIADSMEKICSALNEFVILANGPNDFYIHTVKVAKVRKMDYNSLPVSEKRVSCVASATARNFPSLMAKPKSSYSEDDDDNDDGCDYDAYSAYQKTPIYNAEEIESLNDSVYDNQCLIDIGGEQETYDLGDDDLNNPIYSENQLIFSSDDDYNCGENLEEEDEEEEKSNPKPEESIADFSEESLTEEEMSDTNSSDSTDLAEGVKHIKQGQIKGSDKEKYQEKGKGKGEHKGKGKEKHKGKHSVNRKDFSKDEYESKGEIKSSDVRDQKSKESDKQSGKNKKESGKQKEKHHEKYDASLSTTDLESSDHQKKEQGSSNKHKPKGQSKDHDRGKGKHQESGEGKNDEDRDRIKDTNEGKGNYISTTEDESISKDKDQTGGRKKNKDQGKGKHGSKDQHEVQDYSTSHTMSASHSAQDLIKPRKEKRSSHFEDDNDDKKGGSKDRSDESKSGKNRVSTSWSDKYHSSDDGLQKRHSHRSSRLPSKGTFAEGIANSYPGYSPVAHNMAVIGSENGSYKSFCTLIASGFRVADRILAMTPWGNYALFRVQNQYFLYDGCTCNAERFRHLDLEAGTAGLLSFSNMHELILKIQSGKTDIIKQQNQYKYTVDEICREFCK